MNALVSLLKQHSALLAAAGFVLMAVYAYTQNDLPGAGHDLLLALAALGIKFHAEGILSALDVSQSSPPVQTPGK